MGVSTIDLTAENFEPTVKKDGIVFIDFWAPWCGPCRSFAPVYEQSASKHSDVTFAKVNTDEQQELAAAFEIRGIPTLAVFRDGVLLFKQAGALPAAALEDLVTQAQKLDMDQVRKEIAAAKAKQPPPS
ncbi:MAG: thioredoxin [Myxococcota bacterium]